MILMNCRLFSCGTNNRGESYMAEWNDKKWTVKRYYHGLERKSVGVVQFDIAKNQILAVGDQFVIKFWHLDNQNLATSFAEGGLPVRISNLPFFFNLHFAFSLKNFMCCLNHKLSDISLHPIQQGRHTFGCNNQ